MIIPAKPKTPRRLKRSLPIRFPIAIPCLPFIAADIPAGGVFSGAEGLKNVDQALRHGGQAQEPYDVCYHESCDTELNINQDGLSELLGSVVHAVSWAENVEDFGSRRYRGNIDVKNRMNSFQYRGCKVLR